MQCIYYLCILKNRTIGLSCFWQSECWEKVIGVHSDLVLHGLVILLTPSQCTSLVLYYIFISVKSGSCRRACQWHGEPSTLEGRFGRVWAGVQGLPHLVQRWACCHPSVHPQDCWERRPPYHCSQRWEVGQVKGEEVNISDSENVYLCYESHLRWPFMLSTVGMLRKSNWGPFWPCPTWLGQKLTPAQCTSFYVRNSCVVTTNLTITLI